MFILHERKSIYSIFYLPLEHLRGLYEKRDILLQLQAMDVHHTANWWGEYRLSKNVDDFLTYLQFMDILQLLTFSVKFIKCLSFERMLISTPLDVFIELSNNVEWLTAWEGDDWRDSIIRKSSE